MNAMTIKKTKLSNAGLSVPGRSLSITKMKLSNAGLSVPG